ncbi:ABC transporter ATP-binding protein [Lichenihabitans psoromatis]|uniref:ABC transporter ATP-binding protein n=1 Tax=Lichenihabitans psoromatis TaxID=2528642 RepID=UPI001036577B|nr:ATP-binding cassette domain-containing protein [Lichenihabitans psoromatis]
MEHAPSIAISLQNLVVGFGPHLVIDKLDLDVRRGEILGLVGASGGGKSVLLRTVLGLLPKRSGTIKILGRDVDKLDTEAMHAVERHWGVLFQQGALFSALSVRQNVEFPMREYLALPAALRSEIAVTKLRMVGLAPDDMDKFPAELSGGMIKRVALARSLALEPDIVFLDEPTSGLDPIAAGEFDLLIKTLQRTLGVTVVMATHDLDSLAAVCDRIAALAEGRIVALGAMSAMLASQDPWVKAYFAGPRARRAIAEPAPERQGNPDGN